MWLFDGLIKDHFTGGFFWEGRWLEASGMMVGDIGIDVCGRGKGFWGWYEGRGGGVRWCGVRSGVRWGR